MTWSGRDILLSVSPGDFFFTGLVIEYRDEGKEGNKEEASADIKCKKRHLNNKEEKVGEG